MKYGKYVDLIWLQVVNDSVWPLDHFAELGHLKLCYHPAGKRKICNLLRAPSQTIDSSLGVAGRLLCDVSMDRPKVSKRSVGPVNPHWDNLNSLRTSSTLRVRPDSLSARPDSMA
jgi:hypothetical protein